MTSTGVDREPLLIMTFTTLIGSHYYIEYNITFPTLLPLHKRVRSHFGGLLIPSRSPVSQECMYIFAKQESRMGILA